MTRPPLAYFGGKTLLADRIATLLPEHQHYIEPYCGSLSVLLAKTPTKLETVNDLDAELMTFWRMLRDHPDDLARVCALTPHARAENRIANDRGELPPLEVARRVWVKLSQGRALSLRPGISGGWKHWVYPDGCMPDHLETFVERMAIIAPRLHHVSLECMPALDLIAKYGAEPAALLYVDPPYLGTTRDDRSNYQHEMRAETDHRALAEALHDARAAVVVSGYPSDLYDRELYAGWDRVTLAASTGNAQGDRTRARTEVLWSNRPLANHQAGLFALHDALTPDPDEQELTTP